MRKPTEEEIQKALKMLEEKDQKKLLVKMLSKQSKV